MTADEFRELLQHQTDLELLGPCLRDETVPFAFDLNPVTWDDFRHDLVSQLGVTQDQIRVVGSGRFGFSMKPGYKLKTFSDRSDIDVVIVNAELFDRLWLDLLAAAYPRPPFVQKLGTWLEIRRNELYTGWITPVEIRLNFKIFGTRAKPVLDFKTKWFNALKQASRHPPRRHEDITGRLYRTWNHAELYHLQSLAALRRTLSP